MNVSIGVGRLALSAAEITVLAGSCSLDLPQGFTTAELDDAAIRETSAALVDRDLVVAEAESRYGCRPVPAIAVNLAVLAAPRATVRMDVAVQERGLRAFFAFADDIGASLITLPDGAVELSMFPAETLGRELVRAVPKPDELVTASSRIRRAFGSSSGMALAGRLPLAVLEQYRPARTERTMSANANAAAGPLTPSEAELAQRLGDQTTGTLWCLVSGRPETREATRSVLVGQVVWLATDQGWVGIRPDPDDSDRRLVALIPVSADDIGVWLAPYLGQILEPGPDSEPRSDPGGGQ